MGTASESKGEFEIIQNQKSRITGNR